MTAARDFVEAHQRWLGAIPREWQEVPLWRLFRRVKRTGFEDEQLLGEVRRALAEAP